MNGRFRNPDVRFTFYILLFIGVSALLSAGCRASLLPGAATPNETEIGRAVEATLEAERTQIRSTEEAEVVKNTPEALAATDTAIPTTATTQAPATPAPTETSASTTPSAPSPASQEAIEIDDWKALYWVQLYSGCTSSETKCWKLNDDFKTTMGQNVAYLTSKQEVLIETGWAKPALVYMNKRDLKFEAKITLIVDGKPIDVQVIPIGKIYDWEEEAIDLSSYQGKSVMVQFSCPVGMKFVNSWFIHNVRIVPDYQE
jgi:hypothetical protein